MPEADATVDPVLAALRRLHLSVVSEELPEDFLKILAEIDAKIAAAKGSVEG